MNNMKNQTTRLIEEENCVELSEQDLDAVVGGVLTEIGNNTGAYTYQPSGSFSGTEKDPNPSGPPVPPPGLSVSAPAPVTPLNPYAPVA